MATRRPRRTLSLILFVATFVVCYHFLTRPSLSAVVVRTPGGERTIAPDRVEDLSRLVWSSRVNVHQGLDQLGFTPENIEGRKSSIVHRAWRDTSYLPPELPDQLTSFVTVEAIRDVARKKLMAESAEGTENVVEIEWVGMGLRVWSQEERPWMLPWHVSSAGEKWQTWDPEISRRVLALLEDQDPLTEMLAGESYTSQEFWSDGSLWGTDQQESLGSRLRRHHEATYWKRIEDHEVAPSHFAMKGGRPLEVSLRDREVVIDLVPVEGTIDLMRWHVPIHDGRPGDTFPNAIYSLEEADAVIGNHGWIRELATASDPAAHIRFVLRRLEGDERSVLKRASVMGAGFVVELVDTAGKILYRMLASRSDVRVVISYGTGPDGTSVDYSKKSDPRHFLRTRKGTWELRNE